jgi:hypothetical protein
MYKTASVFWDGNTRKAKLGEQAREALRHRKRIRQKRANKYIQSNLTASAMRTIAVVLCLAIAVFSLAACDPPSSSGDVRRFTPEYPTKTIGGLRVPAQEKTYTSAVIIVGNTANQPQPALSDNVVGYLTQALFDGASLTIISAAGTSKHEEISCEMPNAEIKPGGNERTNMSALSKYVTAIEKAIATDPGKDHLDFFGAVKTAIGSLRAASGNKLLVIIGSGLSDSGLISFAGNPAQLNVNGSELCELLLNSDAGVTASSLNDCDVVLSGIGQVVEPQFALETDGASYSLPNLEGIYQSLLEGMGAVVYVDKTVPSAKESVSTSHVVNITPIITTSVITGTINEGREIDIPDSIVDFVPDTATISNYDEAKANLLPIVKAIEGGGRYELVGYQALPPGVSVGDLPLNRAKAVRDLLVEMGVDPAQITNVRNGGAGQDRTDSEGKPAGANEYDESGKWNSELAQPNRIVVLMPVNE